MLTPGLPLRCKRFFNLESFSSAVGNLEYRSMKRIGQAVTIQIPKRNNRDDLFYVVGSILFIKEVRGKNENGRFSLSLSNS